MSRDLRARVERETGPLPRYLLYVGDVLVREEYAHRRGRPEMLEQIAAGINAAIDARVTELLTANNREVERRREAEAERDRLRAMVDHARVVELLPGTLRVENIDGDIIWEPPPSAARVEQ